MPRDTEAYESDTTVNTNEVNDDGVKQNEADKNISNPANAFLNFHPQKTSVDFAGDPTTAVNLETIGISGTSNRLVSSNQHGLVATSSNVSKTISNSDQSTQLQSVQSDDEYAEDDTGDENTEDNELHEILNGFIRENFNTHSVTVKGETSSDLKFQDLHGLHGEEDDNDNDNENDDFFFNKYVRIDKSQDSDAFHGKLKHFFILSVAGKPIYSLNGDDNVIMGYMGLITTILSTFEENANDEIRSVTYKNKFKVLIMKRHPLIFVAMTKIRYEISAPEDSLVVSNQLKTLHLYLLSILSQLTIDRNFHNRMNYDLRKVLTNLDFQNIDSLCTIMTYGISWKEIATNDTRDDFGFFVSQLLDSCLQSVKLTYTTRSKLSSILTKCKSLKVKASKVKENDSFTSFFTNDSKENEELIGKHLLFTFLLLNPGKVISYSRQKNLQLCNEDLKILFTMVSSVDTQGQGASASEYLWLPLCMPNFNPNGFIYVFVRNFNLAKYVKIDGIDVPDQFITIVLLSGNKDSFYQMQKISDYIVNKVIRKENFRMNLSRELEMSRNLSIKADINTPVIKHFIYKNKTYNQFVMNDPDEFNSSIGAEKTLQLAYLYSCLHGFKSKEKERQYHSAEKPLDFKLSKKLSYIKWKHKDRTVTAFMLADESYEFYSLCDEFVHSKELIEYSLKIIKWCKKYQKRLFIGNGSTF